MKRWALVKNGIVSMIVEQETEPTVFTSDTAFWVDVTDVFVGPDWLYDGEDFSPPPPPEEE
jgi:hypothetical protein